MQNWWTMQELGRMKQREILKKAEIYCRVQKSRPKRLNLHGSLCFLLKKLGKLLVNWGSFFPKPMTSNQDDG